MGCYFNFKPSFKLQWCRARDLFVSQIAVSRGGFELRISCIQSGKPSNLPKETGIWHPNKSRARQNCSLKLCLKLKHLNIDQLLPP